MLLTKHKIGWSIIAVGMYVNMLFCFLNGRIELGIVNFLLALYDTWMVYYWFRQYKKKKMTQREKFLDEIMNKRKK